eukprot:778208-Pleurochrysis_carterae.AAC.2
MQSGEQDPSLQRQEACNFHRFQAREAQRAQHLPDVWASMGVIVHALRAAGETNASRRPSPQPRSLLPASWHMTTRACEAP